MYTSIGTLAATYTAICLQTHTGILRLGFHAKNTRILALERHLKMHLPSTPTPALQALPSGYSTTLGETQLFLSKVKAFS